MSNVHEDIDSNKSVKEKAGAMINEIAGEVKHEVRNIRYAKEPVDPTHSDVVVRRHVTGLSISFFILIALFLLAAIVGIAIYAHGHHAGPPRGVAEFVLIQRAL